MPEDLSIIEQQLREYPPKISQQFLDILLTMPGEEWFLPGALAILSERRENPIDWGRIATVAKSRGIYPPQLEKAVDEYRRDQNTDNQDNLVGNTGLNIINAEALRHKVFPPEKSIIEGILPTGCTVLAGRSKDGKSLMAWGLSVAIATGGAAFGTISVPPGDVLYLALEDGERRAQKRLNAQLDRAPGDVDLSRLDIVPWEAPTLGNGLEGELSKWIATKSDPRLIIIDILEKVRPRTTKSGNVYAEAYAATAPLTQLAQENNLAILVVHHVSKIRSDDIRDTISGPISLIGGADTFWVLKRTAGAPDATLSVGGRDILEQELALRFEDGFWTILGGAEEYRLSKTRQEIIHCLSESDKPQTPKQIHQILPQIGYETVKKTLQRMADDGQIMNLGHGRYGLNPSCEIPASYQEETGTYPVPGVPAVPGVPGVPGMPGDSAHGFPVPENHLLSALKTNSLEDSRDKGTAGTPDDPDMGFHPLCPSCYGDLLRDTKGFYCLICRERVLTTATAIPD